MQPHIPRLPLLSAWLLAVSWGHALGLLQGLASLVLSAASLVYVCLQIREKWRALGRASKSPVKSEHDGQRADEEPGS